VMQVVYPSNIRYPGRRVMRAFYEC
jgi:hypothetical protein